MAEDTQQLPSGAGPGGVPTSNPEPATGGLTDIFNQAQESAKTTGKHNILQGILFSAMAGHPGPLMNAIQSNQQLEQNAQLGRQMLGTPEFQQAPKQYQELATQFAGRGDIQQAYHMINAGRMSQQREFEANQQKDLVDAAEKFQKTGDATDYENVLMKQNPNAWATLKSRERTETKQNLGSGIQALETEQKGLAADKSTAPVAKMDALFTQLRSLNLTPEQYNMDPAALVKQGVLKKDQAEAFGRIKDQMATQGLSLEKPNDLVNTARKDIYQAAPGVAKFLGINPPQQQVAPADYLQQAYEKSVAPEALQKYQSQKQRGQEINQQIQQMRQQQGSQTFLTKPSGNEQIMAKQTPDATVRIQDSTGSYHEIPAKSLSAAKKRDPKLKVMDK